MNKNLFYLDNPFANPSNTRLVFIYILAVLIIAFIIFVILVILERYTISKERRMLGYGKNNIRLFSINYKENKVYVIDKINLKEKRTMDLEWFYSSFIHSDKTRLKVWLLELTKEEHKVPHHIEVHVYIKKIKINVFSILEVDSINYEKGIIHLESHLFPNITKIKKDKNSKIFIKPEDQMPEVMTSLPKEPVTLFNVRLYSTYEFDSKTKFRADHIVVTQIVNRLVKYLNSSRYLTLTKSNEIVITDFSVLNTNGAVAEGHNYAREISKILFLNALQNQFSFKIGIVQDKKRDKSFKELVKIAKEMSIFAEDNDIQSPVILYDSTLNYQQLSQSSIVDEIKQIIEKDDIVKKYTPIYNGKNNGFLVGYLVDFIPNKSLLSSITEMQEYAYNNSLSNSLLHTMFNFAHVPLIGTDATVFMSLQLPYYKDILELFYEGNELLSNTVFIFEDKNIESFQEEGKTALQVLDQLVLSSILIGLSFTSSVLELSNEILEKFSFFIFDEKNFQDLLSSPQKQILFQGLINKIKDMNATTIVTNVTSWQMLEYFGKNGIDYFSSELVGCAFDKVPLIDERKYTKAIETFIPSQK